MARHDQLVYDLETGSFYIEPAPGPSGTRALAQTRRADIHRDVLQLDRAGLEARLKKVADEGGIQGSEEMLRNDPAKTLQSIKADHPDLLAAAEEFIITNNQLRRVRQEAGETLKKPPYELPPGRVELKGDPRLAERPSRSQLEAELTDVKQGLIELKTKADEAGVPVGEYDAWLEAHRVTGPEAEPKLPFTQRLEEAVAAGRVGAEARPAPGSELAGEYSPSSVRDLVQAELRARGVVGKELRDPSGRAVQDIISDASARASLPYTSSGYGPRPGASMAEIQAHTWQQLDVINSVRPGTAEAYSQLPQHGRIAEAQSLLAKLTKEAGDAPTEVQLADIEVVNQSITKLESEKIGLTEYVDQVKAEHGEYIHPSVGGYTGVDPTTLMGRLGRRWTGAGTGAGLSGTGGRTRSGAEWDESFTDPLFHGGPDYPWEWGAPQTLKEYRAKNPGATAEEWMESGWGSERVTYGMRGIPGTGEHGTVAGVRELVKERPWWERSDYLTGLLSLEGGGELKGFPTLRGVKPPVDIDPASPLLGRRATGDMPLGFRREGLEFVPGVELEEGKGVIETGAWKTGEVAGAEGEPAVTTDPRVSVNVNQILHDILPWEEDQRQKILPIPGSRKVVYGDELRHERARESVREKARRRQLERVFNVTIPPMWVSEFENKLAEYGITTTLPTGEAGIDPETGELLLEYAAPSYSYRGRIPQDPDVGKAEPGVEALPPATRPKVRGLTKEGKARMRADVQEVAKEINYEAGYGWVAYQTPDIRVYAALRALAPLGLPTQQEGRRAQTEYQKYRDYRDVGIGAARINVQGSAKMERDLKRKMIDAANATIDIRNMEAKLKKDVKRRTGAPVKIEDWVWENMPQKPLDWTPPDPSVMIGPESEPESE